MISIQNVQKTYPTRSGPVIGLQNVSLQIEQGQFVCVRGSSGSGKTTLLLTVGGMQRPTSGQVSVAGTDLYSIGSAEQSRFRSSHIGFVFQLFHLIPYLNVFENVRLGASLHKVGGQNIGKLIEHLGLSHRNNHKPAELSVGECQRVALARALVSEPAVILADEPTGNLDPENTKTVLDILQEYCRDGGTVMFVTHGTEAIPVADRVLRIDRGKVEEESSPTTASAAAIPTDG
jgi:ABC-type lipoprotein export system ATPase subunit